MIRQASSSDSDDIAKVLWDTWHRLKARQIGSRLRAYPSVEFLSAEISQNPDKWLVCELPDSKDIGFFCVSSLKGDQFFQKCGVPSTAIRIDHFNLLSDGETLIQQFGLLSAHFPDRSILVCVSSELRDACWALIKAGFTLLGESPLIVGTYMWFYLDRENEQATIKSKLKRARLIAK